MSTMNLMRLELKKIRRTGFLPAFLGGGILAAAVPAVNTAFRPELFAGLSAPPVSILLGANWQMMSMLNVLLTVAGACVLYHIEYADNAMRKMSTLPVRESSLFFGKAAVLILAGVLLLAIEAVSVFGCSIYWFSRAAAPSAGILKSFGFFLLMLIPAALLSLALASACRNLWTSLGIGVVCVFAATMIPAQRFALTLFPFAMPFQTPVNHTGDVIRNYAIAAAAETIVISLSEVIILKVRRIFA